MRIDGAPGQILAQLRHQRGGFPAGGVSLLQLPFLLSDVTLQRASGRASLLYFDGELPLAPFKLTSSFQALPAAIQQRRLGRGGGPDTRGTP